ncbi:hypothetical protein NW762_003964 [Fusarium torreyae]|uniref:Uncharacterized protein n=1 Tax=Fusarium torreyae TaxID=1237075 RepID=A0A9W8S6L2_9HYPO|nr:hypothetical protein NW762_003964 [Fusarium torreyae]
MDQDIPPNPDDPPPIEGLEAVDISASMVESATTTYPRRAISARLRGVDAEEMPLMSAEDFKGELGSLKHRHDQPDFDAILARSCETVTQVENFLPETEINDFIQQQEESDIVSEFAQNNPHKLDNMNRMSRQQYALEHFISSLQPQQNHDLNTLCEEHGITLWPDLKLYPKHEVQSLLPHQVDEAIHKRAGGIVP